MTANGRLRDEYRRRQFSLRDSGRDVHVWLFTLSAQTTSDSVIDGR